MPKVEPCILSLNVRAPSEFLTWWLLTILWTTVSVALFSISHCITWNKLVGRWEGGKGDLRSGKCLSVPYSSLIMKFRPSFDLCLSIYLSLFLPVCFLLVLHPIKAFIFDPLISWASPNIKKEKEDRSVLFVFSAVIKNIKHLKKALASLSFLLCSCFFFFSSVFMLERIYLLISSSYFFDFSYFSQVATLFYFFYLPGVLKNDNVEAGVYSLFIQFGINWGQSSQRSVFQVYFHCLGEKNVLQSGIKTTTYTHEVIHKHSVL